MAHLDTSFLVPCKHCADLMPEGAPFCPSCGKDQSAAVEAGPPRPAPGDPFGTGRSDSGFDAGIGLMRPDTLWRAEPLRDAAATPWANRAAPPRWWLATAAALVALLVFALVHDSFFAPTRQTTGETSPGLLRDVRGKLDQAQGAAQRGADPRAEQTPAPAVGRGELRAAPGASRGLALAEPAAPAAPVSMPQTPVAGTPAPGQGETMEKGCNDAMAALALCRKN